MAAHNPFTPPLVLHIWPSYESALSIEPECVASLLYLQLCVPGRYTVEYCNNPDLSPSGQLPFLTHGLHSVASFSSIAKYVSRLEGARQLDAHLSPTEKAQTIARVAHVESELGNLVAHVYYALSPNWVGKTHPVLISIMPVPQRYFLPKRMRQLYKPRLEAAELWNAEGVAEEEEEERRHFSFRKASKQKKVSEQKKKRHLLARDIVLDKARAVFDTYTKLLGDNDLFYGVDYPTVLDVVLAAHIHLLQQPMPDPLIQSLLQESCPQLLAHCHRIREMAFPDPLSFPPANPHTTTFSWSSMISLPTFWRVSPKTESLSPEASQTQRHFALFRWGFFAAAVVTMGLYLRLSDVRQQMKILSAQEHARARAVKDALEGRRAQVEEYDSEDDDE